MGRIHDFNGTLAEAASNFTTKIDQADANTLYIGKATFGTATSSPLWQIKKISTVGTETTIAWADGDDDFKAVWDNHTSLDYS